MGTSVKGLRRHYDKLEPLERFRLAAAAFERDDESELRALWDTAPRANYNMVDWPFCGMWEGIHKVAWVAVTEILRSGYLMGVSFGWWVRWLHAWKPDDGAGDGEAGDNGDGWPTGPEVRETATEAAKDVLVAWDALGRFCEELGITVDQALCHAPCVGMARGIVEGARRILGTDAVVLSCWAADLCELDEEEEGADLDVIQAAFEEEVETRHDRRVGEYVADLRKIWNREAELEQ